MRLCRAATTMWRYAAVPRRERTTIRTMAMGKRKRDRQPMMWVPATDLPTAASHPFYRRLNQLLREHGFDDFVEAECAGFYAETMGRPGLPPGIYFRLLLIGYFEGIDAERGIAWRAADSLALRDFLGVGLDQAPPDHSTISRKRRRIALETHRAVFTWILQHKAEHAVDLDTGAIVGVTVQGADKGDTTTIQETLPEAAEQLEAVAAVTDDAVAVIEEVVADKGYHSRTTVHDLETLEIRTYISEPERGPQSWTDQDAERDAVYANRRRIRRDRGKRLLRKRGELLEVPMTISCFQRKTRTRSARCPETRTTEDQSSSLRLAYESDRGGVAGEIARAADAWPRGPRSRC